MSKKPKTETLVPTLKIVHEPVQTLVPVYRGGKPSLDGWRSSSLPTPCRPPPPAPSIPEFVEVRAAVAEAAQSTKH